MSDIAEKATLELLTQKRDFITNILTSTQVIGFTGIEEDAQTYIELMEKRQAIFQNIADIDKALQEKEHADRISSADGELLERINQLIETIQRQAKQVIALDNKNKDLVDKARSLLSDQIKGVRQGKNLKNMYQTDRISGYTKFDKSQ